MLEPRVTIIVPFAGIQNEGVVLLKHLRALERERADRVLIVDNSPDARPGRFLGQGAIDIDVLIAGGERSSYYARNRGVLATQSEWILFMDADCQPAPDLLKHYFGRAIAEDVGIIVGEVEPAEGGGEITAQFAARRRHLNQGDSLAAPRPFGATANLMVRRRAWEEAGGFSEGIRSAGDQDFCWRVTAAGWKLAYRKEAVVRHLHRTTVEGLARQWLRYGAGRSWLARRCPGSYPAPPAFRRCAAALARLILRGAQRHRREAMFAGLDLVVAVADSIGWRLDNRPARSLAPRPGREMFLCECWPQEQEQCDAQFVLAARRAVRPRAWTTPEGTTVRYLEDDGPLTRVLRSGVLLVKRPDWFARVMGRSQIPVGLSRWQFVVLLSWLCDEPPAVIAAAASALAGSGGGYTLRVSRDLQEPPGPKGARRPATPRTGPPRAVYRDRLESSPSEQPRGRRRYTFLRLRR